MAHLDQTRVAVAGAGYIGRAHIAAIQASPNATLSAIVDPSNAAESFARQASIPYFASISALLDADRPDGLVLATPNALHVPQALQCIAAGLPILLEKPIATTLGDAEHLVTAVAETGARVLIGHHRAHSPIMDEAKKVIASGQLGRLVAVMGSALFYKPDHYFTDAPWRREPGAGPILLNMIHEVHDLRMLCGEIIAVQAFASNKTRGFLVGDTVAINLRFANGALGTFILSDTAAAPHSWEQTSQENPAYPTYDDTDCYTISGTNGTLSVPTMRLKTYPGPDDRSWWKPFEVSVVRLLRSDPIKHQIEHFVQVIHGTASPLVSARDGLFNLRVTEAIVEAARSGEVVTLPA
jgi:predicted dehydrogenase